MDQLSVQAPAPEKEAPDQPEWDWNKILWMTDPLNQDPVEGARRQATLLPDWDF
jgi:hypothetical protein